MASTTYIGRGIYALGAFAVTCIIQIGRSGDYLLGTTTTPSSLGTEMSTEAMSDEIHYAAGATTKLQRTPQAEVDRIVDLPGLSETVSFEQFSGYLSPVSSRHVFYWYVESQGDPNNDPVVLWTNGGPGCSGLLGFGTEHGPFVPLSNGTLLQNEYSWNLMANMLYIEQPAGVGFSYTDTRADKITGDLQAAHDNYHVVLEFLKKFPERQAKNFYIASESYGGHYMPQLALEILEKDVENKINFRGMMVGNPYVDPFTNAVAEFESFYSHGLLAKPLYDEWAAKCRSPRTFLSKECDQITNAMFQQFGDGINPYALDYPVCVEGKHNQRPLSFSGRRYLQQDEGESTGQRTSSSQVDTLLNRTRMNPPFLPSQDQYKPCSQVNLERYLNRHDVRSAIHVLDNAAYKWSPCGGVNYAGADVDIPVVVLYKELLQRAVKAEHSLNMLIYSGDDDSICATIGTQYWMWDLGVKSTTKTWKAWKVNEQTAGFVTHFDLGKLSNASFAFATVHGAGHEVPAYRPMEALALFQKFLKKAW